MTGADRRWRLAIWALTALALVGLAVLWVVLPPLIEDAYLQRPGALLSGVISGQKRFPLEGYLVFFKRTLLALGVASAVVGGLLPLVLRWSAGTRGAVSGTTASIVLAVAVAAILGQRLVTYAEPQDRDQMAYMMVADGMLAGRPLYAATWDHKPPALHLTYAVAAAIFGRTDLAFFVLGAVSALITLAGCYRVGRLVGGVAGGVTAAIVWTLASGDLLLQANQPSTEVFMNAVLIWAFAIALGDERPRTNGQWALVGLLFFAGTLYKPVVAAIAGLVLAAHAVARLLERRDESTATRLVDAIRPAIVVGVVAAAGWALTVGYFAAVGRLAAFEEAVFAYNRDYAGSLVKNLLASVLPTGSVVWTATPYFPLLLLVALGALAMLRDARRPALLLLAYLGGAWVAVAMPGRLYPHYYQLLLPPIAVGIGWFTARALAAASPLRLTLVGASLALVLTARVYQTLVPPADVPMLKYGGYGYDLIETRRMGPWIASHSPEGASVYHWGADPGIYFYAGRRSPVTFVYNMPLTDGTDRARRYTAQVLSELQQHPPSLVVATRREFATIDHPIESWIDQRYHAVDGPSGVERFLFLVPRDQSTPSPKP